jgi:hypothetical protein
VYYFPKKLSVLPNFTKTVGVKTFAIIFFLVIKAFWGNDCRPENTLVSPQNAVTVITTEPVQHRPVIHTPVSGYAEENSEDKEGYKNSVDRQITLTVNPYTVFINLSLYCFRPESVFRLAPYHILHHNLRL